MSRTAASVISLVLGFPILAMVAVATVGGYNPKLLTTFLVGGVVMAFVVGAIFEIKRLLDSEDHAGSATTGSHAKPLEITVSDAPVDAPVAQEPVAPPAPERESRVETASSVPADAAIAPEPIVEPLPAAEPTPIKAKPAVKSGRAKRIAVSDAAPEETAVAPKPKRKPGRSKQATPV